MFDDNFVLRIERLRDDLELLKREVRQRVKTASGQVTAMDIRKIATSLAERWLVDVAPRADVAQALGGSELADRSIQFQRILTYADRATQRRKYDQAFSAILGEFRNNVIVPLKARRSAGTHIVPAEKAISLRAARIVFVGKSFSASDERVNKCVERLLSALGLTVSTGEKPTAGTVSKKVRTRIDRCDVFVGIFTRRDKIEGKDEWTTSTWVVDEKAYALAGNRKLVLLREIGVTSIGGLQGDYEYHEFDRSRLEELIVTLVEVFRSEE